MATQAPSWPDTKVVVRAISQLHFVKQLESLRARLLFERFST